MATLTGLPDFASIITSPEATMVAPFGGGAYSVLPQQLTLASNADGSPKFQLDLVQSLGDLTAAGQYAELDCSLAGDFPLDQALTLVRSTVPSGTVQPITMTSGYGRLYATSGDNTVALPADMLAPIPLGWWSNDLARWTMRISRDAGVLLQGALQGESSLLLGARVEVAVTGVAPRLALFVQFQPVTLLTDILQNHPDRTIAVAEIVSFFLAGTPTSYPVALSAAIPAGQQVNLAQLMTDRIVGSYAALVPAPGVTDSGYVQFRSFDQIDSAQVRWDLNEAALGMRPWVFLLDPLAAIRALNDPAILSGLVKEISIPPLQIGLFHVDLTASLPPSRAGISAIGAQIEVAPNPPMRPFSINKTVLFTPPADSGSVDLALAPSEVMDLSVTCFAVIAAGDFVQQYEGAAQSFTQSWVQVAGGDFPLTFAHVSASTRLLSLATVAGILTYQVGSRTVQTRFTLNGGEPEITVAAPSTAANTTLALQAVPLDASAPITLTANAMGRTQLDVNSFAGYGPHQLSVEAPMVAGVAPLFLELVPELLASDPAALPGKIALSADQPSANWGYFATSPFHPGYCFRLAAAVGGVPGPWSAVRLSDAVLTLNPDGTVAADGISDDAPPSGSTAVPIPAGPAAASSFAT
jgi:hypothetical protein